LTAAAGRGEEKCGAARNVENCREKREREEIINSRSEGSWSTIEDANSVGFIDASDASIYASYSISTGVVQRQVGEEVKGFSLYACEGGKIGAKHGGEAVYSFFYVVSGVGIPVFCEFSVRRPCRSQDARIKRHVKG